MIEVRRHVLRHFRASLKDRLESLRREAEFTLYRNPVGHILVTALSVLSLYTLALSMLPGLQGSLHVNFAVSPIVILSFALIFLPVILSSGFRRSSCGAWRTDPLGPDADPRINNCASLQGGSHAVWQRTGLSPAVC